MLISQSKQFVFVHVPKTAGTSICEALAGMNDTVISCKLLHPPAKKIRQELGEQKWGGFYKFAFVRNPWARLVSWYNALQEHPPLPQHKRVRDELSDFKSFVKYGVNYGLPIWRNQIDWISYGVLFFKKIVGRFETLEEDFAVVCKHLGMTPELPHTNATSRVDYREYYSPAMWHRVKENYSRDIAAFNYPLEWWGA